MTIHRGHCHCGNIDISFESEIQAADIAVRACDCGFCRRHGMRAVSDPAGRIAIAIHDAKMVNHYRFGLKTADYLVCAVCGVYVSAILWDGDAGWAIINVNVLDNAQEFSRQALVVNYDAESKAERRDRRRANWTPVTVGET